MSVYQIALSGMNAQSKAVSIYAQNIANMQSGGKPKSQTGERAAYIPLDPVSISDAAGGVRVESRPVDPASVPVYSPDSVDADGNGLVEMPNIRLEEQIVGSMIAKTGYAANAKMFAMQRDLDRALLDILG